MSHLRITCPRCQASLSVSHHQEQAGHLGCTHCGQLIRLAPRQTVPAYSAPVLAPVPQPFAGPAPQSGYWNPHSTQRSNQSSGWIAAAIASIGLFLTVLTICITVLLSLQMRMPDPNQVSSSPPPARVEPEIEPLRAAPPQETELAQTDSAPRAIQPDPRDLPPGVTSQRENPLGENESKLLGRNDPLPEPEGGRERRNSPVPGVGGGNVTPPTVTVTPPTPAPEPERPRPSMNSGLIK